MQKVLIALFAAFVASCAVEFYKNVIQKADDELNGAWRTKPAATPHP